MVLLQQATFLKCTFELGQCLVNKSFRKDCVWLWTFLFCCFVFCSNILPFPTSPLFLLICVICFTYQQKHQFRSVVLLQVLNFAPDIKWHSTTIANSAKVVHLALFWYIRIDLQHIFESQTNRITGLGKMLSQPIYILLTKQNQSKDSIIAFIREPCKHVVHNVGPSDVSGEVQMICSEVLSAVCFSVMISNGAWRLGQRFMISLLYPFHCSFLSLFPSLKAAVCHSHVGCICIQLLSCLCTWLHSIMWWTKVDMFTSKS